MNTLMTFDQYRVYTKLATAWADCNCFGIICSYIDRTNDVPRDLNKLGVPDLIPYLLIDEKTKALMYKADIGRKSLIHIVEIYYDWSPHSTE